MLLQQGEKLALLVVRGPMVNARREAGVAGADTSNTPVAGAPESSGISRPFSGVWQGGRWRGILQA
jgi:hypothetical protein